MKMTSDHKHYLKAVCQSLFSAACKIPDCMSKLAWVLGGQ